MWNVKHMRMDFSYVFAFTCLVLVNMSIKRERDECWKWREKHISKFQVSEVKVHVKWDEQHQLFYIFNSTLTYLGLNMIRIWLVSKIDSIWFNLEKYKSSVCGKCALNERQLKKQNHGCTFFFSRVKMLCNFKCILCFLLLHFDEDNSPSLCKIWPYFSITISLIVT